LSPTGVAVVRSELLGGLINEYRHTPLDRGPRQSAQL